MDALTRVTQQAEKPGRLQLAIIEWQRQLMSGTSTSSTASTAG